ncbi:YidC/Oxa1 family membrane protein insertase [Streptomyces sp. YS415]|uniref:YidC/Oxa1 family membrane protein insertase n=1 Tax=Streptomyces sp. YS415 TaxID=2944806 RepID=UPI002020F4BA|nr:YidC/Oxa1 family membrane protein insertase [Streptomyces sp. YS415]MCL7427517.1 YidC/Oxa1 family membrane protein insertase [Streptomyces sp. YS415]
MSAFARLVEQLAELLQPLFQGSAAAAAIVLFTALVRLLVHPLSRAAARGQKARAALQPQIAELRRKHGKSPEKLQRAVLELHTEHKVSPLAGCLPSLLQAPAFFLLYHLFSSAEVGGRPNELLGHDLFTAPLGDRWADALSAGGTAGLVYAGLFALVAAVAFFNYRLSRKTLADSAPLDTPGAGAITKVMPFISFFTLITVAVVPLAAALYIVTSSAWSAVERAVLYR